MIQTQVLGRALRGTVLGRRYAAGALLFLAPSLLAQAQQGDTTPKPYKPPPMFTEEQPVEFTLIAPIGKLRRDRQEDAEYRPAEIKYKGTDGAEVRIPVRVRTRGIWRKKNCEIPPLMLNFTNDSTKNTLFARLDRARHTLHCRNNDEYEQYVLKEFQLYRVHRLLEPLSYNARLARVTYVDSEKNDTLMTRWAFLSETDEAFAVRHGTTIVTTQGAGPDDVDPYESAFYGVFQFFVGNTDYSIRALHNAVLILKNDVYYPVARDFDWTGAVDARYCQPNPMLKIRSCSTRLMRGFCAPTDQFEKVFALFREKKDAIYALYRDSIAAPMKPTVVASTLKYFDEFYETINDPRRVKREILDACMKGSM